MLTDIKAFIGMCVYYRVWIKGFSFIAERLFWLTRKNREFLWTEPQLYAMDKVKRALTSTLALQPIDYEDSGLVEFFADSSLQVWGAVLQQEDPKTRKRLPARYESGMWTDAEKKYDSGKLECAGLLKVLKKFRYYLYGVKFWVEINARKLVY